jgi:hypothetical protein
MVHGDRLLGLVDEQKAKCSHDAVGQLTRLGIPWPTIVEVDRAELCDERWQEARVVDERGPVARVERRECSLEVCQHAVEPRSHAKIEEAGEQITREGSGLGSSPAAVEQA